MTRAENVARIQALLDSGLTSQQAAERLGLAYSTVRGYVTDPDGAKAHKRKASYAGVCEICGAPTTGSDGRALAPTRCVHHNHGAEVSRQRAGTRGVVHDILVLIGDGLDRYSELRDSLEVSSGYMAVELNRLLSSGFIERISWGRYQLTERGRQVTA